jgi:hypothetical protein
VVLSIAHFRNVGVELQDRVLALGAARLFVFVVDEMEHRQHALVKNRNYANAVRAQSVENDVLALLVSKEAGSNLVARATALWIFSKLLTAGFELAQIAGALLQAPRGDRVGCDAVEVRFGALRKMVLAHGSAQRRKAVLRTDAIEDSRFGIGASVTFVNRGAELGHLRIVSPLLALERSDAHAHHLFDAGGAAGGNLCFGKANDFIRQVDMAHAYSVETAPDCARKTALEQPGDRARRARPWGEKAGAHELVNNDGPSGWLGRASFGNKSISSSCIGVIVEPRFREGVSLT